MRLSKGRQTSQNWTEREADSDSLTNTAVRCVLNHITRCYLLIPSIISERAAVPGNGKAVFVVVSRIQLMRFITFTQNSVVRRTY